MASNKKRNEEVDLDYPEGPTEAEKQAAFDASQDGPRLDPGNADEARAVGDPAPDWATGDSAPEVMSSRDMRRAGVIERMRGNAGHGASLEQRADGGAVIVVGPAGAWLQTTLRAEMTTDENSAAHAVEDIIGRVMNASTAEELFAEDNTVDVREIIGVPLQIWGFKVNESEFQQGMPGYMVINAVRRETKEDMLVTCGAYKVQAQLLRAKTLGLFPILAHFVSNQTRAGNTTFGLVLDKG